MEQFIMGKIEILENSYASIVCRKTRGEVSQNTYSCKFYLLGVFSLFVPFVIF